MTGTFDSATHEYRIDGVLVPSLTQMLAADGWNDHLWKVPAGVLERKRDWGTRLAYVLHMRDWGEMDDWSEADWEPYSEFAPHIAAWDALCYSREWLTWEHMEQPIYVRRDGRMWAFTPDRMSPQAVVEIKGTCRPYPAHQLQTALQVIGAGYSRSTPRYAAYFDRGGYKKTVEHGPKMVVNGDCLDVFDEAERILWEHALEEHDDND